MVLGPTHRRGIGDEGGELTKAGGKLHRLQNSSDPESALPAEKGGKMRDRNGRDLAWWDFQETLMRTRPCAGALAEDCCVSGRDAGVSGGVHGSSW